MIRKYEETDSIAIFDLMINESDEWEYAHTRNQERYREALASSIAYVVIEDDCICGYIRCRDDAGFGIYIIDLLVDKHYRGKRYGKELMKQVCLDYPNDLVYVTSDVDPYYEKQGCQKVGTVFSVTL